MSDKPIIRNDLNHFVLLGKLKSDAKLKTGGRLWFGVSYKEQFWNPRKESVSTTHHSFLCASWQQELIKQLTKNAVVLIEGKLKSFKDEKGQGDVVFVECSNIKILALGDDPNDKATAGWDSLTEEVNKKKMQDDNPFMDVNDKDDPFLS